jgi:hypothetical protein
MGSATKVDSRLYECPNVYLAPLNDTLTRDYKRPKWTAPIGCSTMGALYQDLCGAELVLFQNKGPLSSVLYRSTLGDTETAPGSVTWRIQIVKYELTITITKTDRSPRWMRIKTACTEPLSTAWENIK